MERVAELQDRESLGGRLLYLRSLCGLSQRELAKRAGLTNSVISTIEQNKVSPSISSLERLLAGLGVTITQFFSMSFGDVAGSEPSVELSLPASKGLAVSQREVRISSNTVLDLSLANAFSGCSIVCVVGHSLLRSALGEQFLDVGCSVFLPPSTPYVLVNPGAAEAILWLAEQG